MEIVFYSDIYPGLKPENIHMSQRPGYKGQFAKRFKVVVDIPDEAIYGKVDGILPVNEITDVESNE